MQLRERYKAPLLSNPYPHWLQDHHGDHFSLLRIFAEACWAKAGFHSQAYRRPADVSWDDRIFGRPQLFDYYVELRQESLKQGFFTLTDTQLDDLMTLELPRNGTDLIRNDFVRYSRRHSYMTDQYGQPLPDRLFSILLAIETAPPFRQQGACSLVKKIKLNGKQYFAKMNDEVISDSIVPGEEEYCEVTSHHALRALYPAIVPSDSFHIITADGQQCLLTTAVANGYTYAPENHRKAAPYVDLHCLQWIVLSEWICGLIDRHAGNLIIQKTRKHAIIIDNALSWHFQPPFLGWDEEEGFFSSFARGMWEFHDTALTFHRAILEEVITRESAVLKAMEAFTDFPYGNDLRKRFAILQQALAQSDGDVRLSTIEQIAYSWYNSAEGE